VLVRRSLAVLAMASFWTALSSSVHYPAQAPALEEVLQVMVLLINNPLQTVYHGFSPSQPVSHIQYGDGSDHRIVCWESSSGNG
jgi:hypothetical protein